MSEDLGSCFERRYCICFDWAKGLNVQELFKCILSCGQKIWNLDTLYAAFTNSNPRFDLQQLLINLWSFDACHCLPQTWWTFHWSKDIDKAWLFWSYQCYGWYPLLWALMSLFLSEGMKLGSSTFVWNNEDSRGSVLVIQLLTLAWPRWHSDFSNLPLL